MPPESEALITMYFRSFPFRFYKPYNLFLCKKQKIKSNNFIKI